MRVKSQMKPIYVRIGVPVILGLLLVLVRLPAVSAWQLGWSTTDSNYKYGVGAYQEVTGSIPQAAPDYVAAVTGFTEYDTSCWQTIGEGSADNGSDVYNAGEPCSGGVRICGGGTGYSGPSLGSSYFNNIYWDSANDEWQWVAAACSNHSVTWAPGYTSDTVNGAGSVDMMESTDSTHNDFTSDKATVDFVPSLAYMNSGGTWVWSSDTVTYTNSPPTSLGVSYDCDQPNDIYISSSGSWNESSWAGDWQACS